MPNDKLLTSPAITEELMCVRLAQSEQMREFFIQMWMQNPRLAKRAGKRVQELLSSIGSVVPPLD